MLIYVAHPYNNEEENKKAVEEIIKTLVTNNPEHTFISPIHTFGFMYDFVDNYVQGINMCFNLLSVCKKLILCGDWESSKGCKLEKGFAESRGIPIIMYNGGGTAIESIKPKNR